MQKKVEQIALTFFFLSSKMETVPYGKLNNRKSGVNECVSHTKDSKCSFLNPRKREEKVNVFQSNGILILFLKKGMHFRCDHDIFFSILPPPIGVKLVKVTEECMCVVIALARFYLPVKN